MFANLYRRGHESINLRLRTWASGRWASHCRPLACTFLLTELCNAKCVHCDIWKNRGREEAPSLAQYKASLFDVRKWLGPVRVGLTGGEALLKPYTIDLAAFGSAIGLFVEVLTHGYWDDQSKIEQLMMARPWMIAISLDGIGETHDKIRGREGFFEKTTRTIETAQRVRKQKGLDTIIRLKTVVMAHNLDDLEKVARFASQHGVEVFYQPITQNYNTPEDPLWFEKSYNWPLDTEKTVRAVRKLIEMKRGGFPIANSYTLLEAMIPYFRDPGSLRVLTQSQATERRISCSALTLLQVQANGDVTTCCAQKPVGNIKSTSIREIWESRPHWWESGCCLERRMTEAEKKIVSFHAYS